MLTDLSTLDYTIAGDTLTHNEIKALAETGELLVMDPHWQPLPDDLFDQITDDDIDTIHYEDIEDYGQVVEEDVSDADLIRLASFGYLYAATAVDEITRVR